MKTNRIKSWFLFVILISFSAFGGKRVYAQFGPPQNLSNSPSTKSVSPDVAAEGSNVYVVWSNERAGGLHDVLFRRSADEGNSFGNPIPLSASALNEDALVPRIAVAGPDIYVVWQNEGPEIRFRHSPDQGTTWFPPMTLAVLDATNPAIAAAGPEVYVVWEKGITSPRRILFLRSTDQGMTFGGAMPISDDPTKDAFSPSVAAAGSNVYVTWAQVQQRQPFEQDGILFKRSTDEGATFMDLIFLPKTTGIYRRPSVAAAGSDVFVLWEDETGRPGFPEISFRLSESGGESFTDDAANISDNSGASLTPRVATAGSHLSIVWADTIPATGDFLIRFYAPRSIFLLTDVISFTKEVSKTPSVAAAGFNVYVVWEAGNPGEIMFTKASPISGVAPDTITTQSRPSATPNVAVDGEVVYIVWAEDSGGGSGTDVFFRISIDGGRNFFSPTNLSNNFGLSKNPKVAVAGQNVYVVWQDDADTPGVSEIFFRRSIGGIWDPPLSAPPKNLSATDNDSRAPTIAAIGSEVYVAWEDETTTDNSPQIFSRRSLNQGLTWDPDLGFSPTHSTCEGAEMAVQAFTPSLAVAGSNVYLIWKRYDRLDKEPKGGRGKLRIFLNFTTNQMVPRFCNATEGSVVRLTDNGSSDIIGIPSSPLVTEPQVAAAGSMAYAVWRQNDEIHFRSSRIGGAMFPEETSWIPMIGSPSIKLSGEDARSPTIATTGSEVYVAWENGAALGVPEIYFRRSHDMGANFSLEQKLSNNKGSSQNPWLATAGSDVYLTWQDDTFSRTFFDVLFRSSTDEGETFPSRSVCKGPISECQGDTLIGTPIVMDSFSGDSHL